MAIVKLNPDRLLSPRQPPHRYAGLLRLDFGLAAGAHRPSPGDDGQTLVGFMNEFDYQAEAAYHGKGLMQFAVASPDYDFILISDAIDAPLVTELVQSLRKDFRTARLPVGVMARGERLEKMKEAFEDDTLTTVFPRIHDSEMAGFEVSRLVRSPGGT